jgi:cytochrome c-type biogenesis protein CcmH
MLFWIVAGALGAVVGGLLAVPLLRPAGGAPPASDREVYRDQLAELARDIERGLLAPEEAERARVEVARRLLLADRAGAGPLKEAPAGATRLAVAASAVLLVMGSLALYGALGAPGQPDAPRAARLLAAEAARAARPTQGEAEAAAPDASRPPSADLAPLVERLRAAVPTRPEDLEGWALLADIEASLGRYADAARAQERVVALKGSEATVEDRALLADLLVAAAGGVVTEAAEATLAPVARADGAHPAVLYYLGLLDAQVGRPDRAFPLWRKLAEDGPDGRHRELALAQIGGVARAAGVDWTPPPGTEPAASPEAEAEMIRGMVESLRARLDAEGGPPEDWARLVTSLAVLGDGEGAAEVLARGRAAHGGDAGAEAVLAEAARRAGLP